MNCVQLGNGFSSLLRLSLAMSLLSCTAALGLCSAFLPPLPIPEAAGWGLVQDLSPEMKVEWGLGPDAFGHQGMVASLLH